MKTKINGITGSWKLAKNKCRTTVNKDATDNEPSRAFIYNLLISEHSPIRVVSVDWSWNGIKYWTSQEWARHKFEKFISTQRSDRTNVDRNKLPQDAPVSFDGYANAQNLIDAWRKRLCLKAAPEAYCIARDFKEELHITEPELADVLVPNCVYRCGCPEFEECGYWTTFKACNMGIDITDIKERYKAYNNSIYREVDENVKG